MIAFDLINIFLSSDDGDGYILLLLASGPTAAIWFFKNKHKKYRNFDQTHSFETETSVNGENMVKEDTYVGERKKTKDAFVEGRNSNDHRRRVQEV